MEQIPTPDQLKELAIEAIEKQDRFAAVELLNQYDPALAADIYLNLQSEFYWKRKDVPLMVAISQAGIQHGLTAAGRCDGDEAKSLRSKAKALAFNLASFTWPGWDEKGITFGPSDLAAGMEAARLNLRLAIELDKLEKAKANAFWAVGAHLLVASKFNGAGEAFANAAARASLAGEIVITKSMETYAQMVSVLAAPNDIQVRNHFDTAVASLKQSKEENAGFFADQILQALIVFQRTSRIK